jgi:hypothetical protein
VTGACLCYRIIGEMACCIMRECCAVEDKARGHGTDVRCVHGNEAGIGECREVRIA